LEYTELVYSLGALNEVSQDMSDLESESFDRLGLGSHADSQQWLIKLVREHMGAGHIEGAWHSKLSDQGVVAGPLEESLAESDCEEAEKAVDVEVVCSFVAITSFDGKDLLGQLRVFRVFDLPQSHQIVRLRAKD